MEPMSICSGFTLSTARWMNGWQVLPAFGRGETSAILPGNTTLPRSTEWTGRQALSSNTFLASTMVVESVNSPLQVGMGSPKRGISPAGVSIAIRSLPGVPATRDQHHPGGFLVALVFGGHLLERETMANLTETSFFLGGLPCFETSSFVDPLEHSREAQNSLTLTASKGIFHSQSLLFVSCRSGQIFGWLPFKPPSPLPM